MQKMRGGTDLCDCPNLNGMQVDDAVCDYLLQYTNENSNIYSLLEKLKSKLKSESPSDSAKEIDNRITKILAEINTLLNRLSDISINQTVIKHITDRIEILDSELSKAKLQKEDIESKNKNIEDNELQLDILSLTLSNFKNSFNLMSMQEKRNMLRLLIQKIEWDGKDLHIFICGE